MSADLLVALYAVAAGAVFTATYALGHRHGRAYVSDRTFGPVAAGLVRIEAASEALDVLADEPVPYWPADDFGPDHSLCCRRSQPEVRIDLDDDQVVRALRREIRKNGGDVRRAFGP